MNVIQITIISLFILQIHSFYLLTDISIDPFSDLVYRMTDFYTRKGNSSALLHPYFFQCANNITDNYENVTNILQNSGKKLGELGNEEECIQHKLTYMLSFYQINITHLTNNNCDDSSTISFINKTQYYTGFCLYEICFDFLQNYLDPTVNQQFLDYFHETTGIYNINILKRSLNDTSNNKIVYNNKTSFYTYLAVFTISGGIVLAILISTVINIIISFVKIPITIKDKEPGDSEESDDSFMNGFSFRDSVNSNDSNLLFKSPKKSKALSVPNNEKQTCQNILNFFDIFVNIKELTSIKSDWYSDKDIELFGLLRLIIMFGLVYNHNFYSLTDMPGEDVFNGTFYHSIFFGFITGSSYANVCWIVLDGAEVGYKLISYYSKKYLENDEKKLKAKYIFKFISLLIPKVLIFLYIFFFFYLHSTEFSKIFNFGLLFDYYGEYFLNNRECYKTPETIFYPFYINYSKMKSLGYENCYRYTNIFTNELYFIILFAILFFIAFKIKSKHLDYFLLFVFIVNVAFSFKSYFSYELKGQAISLVFMFGQNYSERFPHLMINYFIIGIFVGVCYFYYNDTIAVNSISQSEKELPFQFCFDLIQYIDTIKTCSKKLFTLLLLVLQALISLFYIIRNKIYGSYSSYIIDIFDIIVDIYGKIIYALLFGLIILFLITAPKSSLLQSLVQTHLFTVFNRINTVFYCLSDLIIYLVYCVFHFELKLTYQNLIFISLGLLVIIVFLSMAVTIIIEMFIRKGIKYCIRERERLSEKNLKVNLLTDLKKELYKNN